MFLGGFPNSFLRVWRRLSFVWKFQIIFWTIYTVVSFPVHFIGLRYVLGWPAPLYWIVFLKAVEIVIEIMITAGFAKVMDTHWFRLKRAWNKALSVCLIVVFIMLIRHFLLVPVIYSPIYRHFGTYKHATDSGERTVKSLASHTYFVLLYGGWAGIFLLVRASVEGRRKERELLASELKRKEAEIVMLRSQVNPHFLFNAMNTIAYESGGNEKIDHLVEGISDYLRYSLATRTRLDVRLSEEIEATEKFLEVQKIRLGNALEFEIDADPASHKVQVPGIFLQPLVENALKYGGRGTPPPLRIRIIARYVGRDLHVEVANTGVWVPPVAGGSGVAGGVGLENLKARLDLFYPGRFEFNITSEESWTKVGIVFRYPETPSGEKE